MLNYWNLTLRAYILHRTVHAYLCSLTRVLYETLVCMRRVCRKAFDADASCPNYKGFNENRYQRLNRKVN